jgi:hypothetical protein
MIGISDEATWGYESCLRGIGPSPQRFYSPFTRVTDSETII